MNEIGGYLEFELRRRQEFHSSAMRFNSGRNCLEYILLHRSYRRVHIPSYSCNALLKPFHLTGTEYLCYQINERFEPILNCPVAEDEAILYINYYGICDTVVHKLAVEFPKLIVDNSQAFFSPAIIDFDTFYSPRKFFGVPDGGYLYSSLTPPKNLKQDCSFERCLHLLLRIDANASTGYNAYQRNEQRIATLPLRSMSQLTHRLLCSIDYDWVKQVRESNFICLHTTLASKNELSLDINGISGPLVYPYLTESGDKLRSFLQTNNVFCATYWPEIHAHVNSNSFEGRLPKDLIALPVDQRLTHNDMKTVLDLITSYEMSPQ